MLASHVYLAQPGMLVVFSPILVVDSPGHLHMAILHMRDIGRTRGPMWECGLNLVTDEGCHNSLAKQLDLLIQRIVVELNNMGLSIEGL